FDGKAWAFAPDAALLVAPIWHVIDAKGRHIADYDATHVEPLDGAQRFVQVVGVNRGLQAKLRVDHHIERLIKVVKGNKANQRAEHLVAHDLHFRLHVVQYRRRIDSASSLPTDQHFCAMRNGFVDPFLDADGFFFGDERPDVRIFLKWITNFQLLHRVHKAIPEGVINVPMNVNALHTDAHLP